MDATGEFVGRGIVCETPTHGPELYVGPTGPAPPFDTGGFPLRGWDWSVVPDVETEDGSSWGDYTLVGTFDGHVFTPTRPPLTAREVEELYSRLEAEEEEYEPHATPCQPPPEGWRIQDLSRTTNETLDAAFALAEGFDGYARAWVDQEPEVTDGQGVVRGARWTNNPRTLVLNVSVTDDLQDAERQLRQVWGGALCVSTAPYTAARLREVANEVVLVPNLLTAGTRRDHVELWVDFDDGTLQRRYDAQFGPRVVRVKSAIRPCPS